MVKYRRRSESADTKQLQARDYFKVCWNHLQVSDCPYPPRNPTTQADAQIFKIKISKVSAECRSAFEHRYLPVQYSTLFSLLITLPIQNPASVLLSRHLQSLTQMLDESGRS